MKARLQAKNAVSILSGAESDAQTYLQTWSRRSSSSVVSSGASSFGGATITAEYAFDAAALDSEAYRRAFVSLLQREGPTSSRPLQDRPKEQHV